MNKKAELLNSLQQFSVIGIGLFATLWKFERWGYVCVRACVCAFIYFTNVMVKVNKALQIR